MTAWQAELMEANARSRQWEDINTPDKYESVLKEAAKQLATAIKMLDKSADSLSDASAELSETPMQFKVDCLIEEIEGVQTDMKRILEHWERGERE